MFVAAAVTLVHFAAAEPTLVPGVDLVWRAPPGCPDAAAIAGMVGALVRRPPATGRERPRVRAVVSRLASGSWELRLDLHARRGRSRRIARADDCQVLARAAALVIAIHRDPLAVELGLEALAPTSAPPDPVPAPPTSAPPDPVPAPPEPADVVVPPAPDMSSGTSPPSALTPPLLAPSSPPADAPAAPPERPAPLDLDALVDTPAPRKLPQPPRRVAGHLRLDGGLDVGVLPGLGGQLGLFGGLSLARVRLEVGLVGAPLRTTGSAFDDRFDRLAGAARACPTWSRAAVTFALCLGGEAGAIRGAARDLARPGAAWAPWFGLTLTPAVRWRVAGPLALYVAVDGVLALNRPRFSVNPGRDLVHVAGRAGARATFGLELQFARRNR